MRQQWLARVGIPLVTMAVLVLDGARATPASAQPPTQPSTKDVVVTNTSANPVPVTGAVSGTVQAQQSGPWSVGTPTHLGVPAAAIVALEYVNISLGFTTCTGGDTICSNPRQILPNGDRAAFAIPAGMVLVITDIQWFSGNGDSGDTALVYSPSIGYHSLARYASNGDTGAHDRFPAGIVVSTVPTLVFARHEPAVLSILFVRGYLARA